MTGGRFYSNVFSKANIKLVTPNADEQAYNHDKTCGRTPALGNLSAVKPFFHRIS